MFAVRLIAAATLAAAVSFTSAAEPAQSKLSQILLATSRTRPIAFRLLPPDSVASTTDRIAFTPIRDAPVGQLANTQHSTLADVYPPAGTTGIAFSLNLQPAQSTELTGAATPASLATRLQTLSTPRAVQPAATWLTPKATSEWFAKPMTFGAGR